MYISKLDYKGWRGASYRLRFAPNITVLVGLNGCGKTNTLELLAMLTGHEDAMKLLRRPTDKLDYLKIEVRWKTGHRILELDSFDVDKIEEFRASLPHNASYVLQQENRMDDRLVTVRREPIACQKDMIEWLDMHDMKLNFWFKEGHAASLLVSETGGQRYILNAGMRRAPSDVPMLIEHPDQGLHPNLQRAMIDFYLESNYQQLIITTHSPELLSEVRGADDSAYWRSPGNGLSRKGTRHWNRERQDVCIAFDDKDIQW